MVSHEISNMTVMECSINGLCQSVSWFDDVSNLAMDNVAICLPLLDVNVVLADLQ